MEATPAPRLRDAPEAIPRLPPMPTGPIAGLHLGDLPIPRTGTAVALREGIDPQSTTPVQHTAEELAEVAPPPTPAQRARAVVSQDRGTAPIRRGVRLLRREGPIDPGEGDLL